MIANYSSKVSRNGVNFHQFVKSAKENKKFRFVLDGRTYVADEYMVDEAILWNRQDRQSYSWKAPAKYRRIPES